MRLEQIENWMRNWAISLIQFTWLALMIQNVKEVCLDNFKNVCWKWVEVSSKIFNDFAFWPYFFRLNYKHFLNKTTEQGNTDKPAPTNQPNHDDSNAMDPPPPPSISSLEWFVFSMLRDTLLPIIRRRSIEHFRSWFHWKLFNNHIVFIISINRDSQPTLLFDSEKKVLRDTTIYLVFIRFSGSYVIRGLSSVLIPSNSYFLINSY